MTGSTPPAPERRELGTLFRDRRAAEALGVLTSPVKAEHLELDCSNVTQIDTYGTAVIRATLDAHLAADPRHRATIVEPTTSAIWPFLSDAVGRPPSGSKWAGTRSPATRGTDVLIPATPVRHDEAPLIVRTVGIVAAALHHGIRPGQLLAEAAQVFLDNVADHAPGAPTSPVVCAAFEPVSKNLQLVCINLAPPGTPVPANEAEIERMLDDPDEVFRSLGWLARRSRADLDFSLRIISGAARARHRTGRGWSFASEEPAVPGFIAGIEIHR